MNTPTIQTASVKVMRSYDYCHFEVCLSSSDADTPDKVDALRKEAARLADKAVTQYIVAKQNAELILRTASEKEYTEQRIKRLENIPESERLPSEKADLKAFQDKQFRERPRYDYQDDWNTSGWDDEE